MGFVTSWVNGEWLCHTSSQHHCVLWDGNTSGMFIYRKRLLLLFSSLSRTETETFTIASLSTRHYSKEATPRTTTIDQTRHAAQSKTSTLRCQPGARQWGSRTPWATAYRRSERRARTTSTSAERLGQQEQHHYDENCFEQRFGCPQSGSPTNTILR